MFRIIWKDGEIEEYDKKEDYENRLYFLDMICGYAEGKDYKIDRQVNGKTEDI